MERIYDWVIIAEEFFEENVSVRDVQKFLKNDKEKIFDSDCISISSYDENYAITVERKVWETDEEMQKRYDRIKEKEEKEVKLIAYNEKQEYEHYLKLKEKYEKN